MDAGERVTDCNSSKVFGICERRKDDMMIWYMLDSLDSLQHFGFKDQGIKGNKDSYVILT